MADSPEESTGTISSLTQGLVDGTKAVVRRLSSYWSPPESDDNSNFAAKQAALKEYVMYMHMRQSQDAEDDDLAPLGSQNVAMFEDYFAKLLPDEKAMLDLMAKNMEWKVSHAAVDKELKHALDVRKNSGADDEKQEGSVDGGVVFNSPVLVKRDLQVDTTPGSPGKVVAGDSPVIVQRTLSNDGSGAQKTPTPPPPAPPLMPALSPAKGSPRVQLKRVHWKPLQPGKVPGDSFWNSLREAEPLAFDTKDLERCFRRGPSLLQKQKAQALKKSTASGDSSKGKKAGKPRLVSGLRAYNVEIALSQLRLPNSWLRDRLLLKPVDNEGEVVLVASDENSGDEVKDLADSTHLPGESKFPVCPASGLSIEQLDILGKIMPTEAEEAAIKAYDGDASALGRVEAFFVAMCQVPRVLQRVLLLRFMLEADSLLAEIVSRLQLVRQATIQIRRSEHLRTILRLILTVGNYMNTGGGSRGGAFGFQLSFLSQLSFTKAADSKVTLMHWLCSELDKPVFKDAKSFLQELSAVPLAAKVESGAFAADLTTLVGRLNALRIELSETNVEDPFHARLEAALARLSPVFQAVSADHAEVQEQTRSLAEYFGEDGQGRAKWEVLLQVFADFMAQFESSQADLDSQRVEPAKVQAPRRLSGTRSTFAAASSDKGEGLRTALLEGLKDQRQDVTGGGD